MPDWFYRTVARPLLCTLSAAQSRRVAVGFMGGVVRIPLGLGERLIDFLGHMRPAPQLRRVLAGFSFDSPVGLGPKLDPAGHAVRAWARFGFGFLEAGPVRVEPTGDNPSRLERRMKHEALWISGAGESVDPSLLARNLSTFGPDGVPIVVRFLLSEKLSPEPSASALIEMARRLGGPLRILSIDGSEVGHWTAADWGAFWRELRRIPEAKSSALLLVVRSSGDWTNARQAVDASNGIVAGWIVDGVVAAEGGLLSGLPARESVLECVKQLRRLDPSGILIASGGIHQPEDARSMLRAGASLVQIDTGLVFSGPGLCKRINEALLSECDPDPGVSFKASPLRWSESSWFWSTMLGVAMLLGSVIALAIASTKVVLPYDEAFCGWNIDQMRGFNPRLPMFLTHDRVTLAGTMVAVGWLYVVLSCYGVRRGVHWARTAVLTSAGTGFFSFFLFLGFGYFDPFHGFVTAILFQLFAMGLHGRPSPSHVSVEPDWNETRAWKRAQWGQLLLVLHGAGLMAAGLIIASVGVGEVFVPEDLAYLQTSAEAIRKANAKLVPLVAHDRATLGGMLVVAGMVYLLSALWGLRKGERWLWHGLLWAGLAAYTSAIGVHLVVGYLDVLHLAPALIGLALLLCGLAALRSWMFVSSSPPSQTVGTG